MINNNFSKRKKIILARIDNSNKGYWDKKIVKLCDKINKKENYYTTSSCSGRVVILLDKDKKGPGVFIFVTHGLVNLNKLKRQLNKIKSKELIKFKQESCILHVSCKTLKDAQNLLDKAKLVGWKRSGIIATTRRIVCELMSTEKLEFPIVNNGKALVTDAFLELIAKKSNENLKKSWGKIEEFGKLIK